MVEDNKMWEGHRIIYPHLRDKYQESKKMLPVCPLLDQQKLESLHYSLVEALQRGEPLKITFWTEKGPQEKKIVLPAGQDCLFFLGRRPFLKGQDEGGSNIRIFLDKILEIG